MRSQVLRRTAVQLLVTLLITQGSIGPSAQTPRTGANPPAAFADPDRRAKLATAFPEIDKLVA
jgi:hypothetical protein